MRSSRPAPKHSRAFSAPKFTAHGEQHSPAVKRTDVSETSCVRLRLPTLTGPVLRAVSTSLSPLSSSVDAGQQRQH